MKFLSIVGLSLFFTAFVQAGIIEDRVASILPGKLLGNESLVLLKETGRVLRTSNDQLVKSLAESSNTGALISFIEDQDQILSFAKSEIVSDQPTVLDSYRDDTLPSFSMHLKSSSARYTDANYSPSDLASTDDAQKLMDELKINEKSNSQCYQRAHLWSIEMLQMANVRSEKVFLFFSERYMREYRFHWWFHVAPFVLINNQESVIDPSFLDHPADMQTWVNFFMFTHPTCKVVASYQEYEALNDQEYCLLRKLPMFYFEPTQVEARDKNNEVITQWIEDQVISAYASLRTAPWIKR